MCGIAGIFGTNPGERLTHAMLERLAHRGPDGAGVHRWDSGSIGACRLWVRGDARVELPQLMSAPPAVVAYNGEVYCRDPAALQEQETPLSPEAELEILLAALRAGRAADGMYAVAIFSPETGALRLDRDPLGIKPLFWRSIGDGVAFASELRPLLHPALGASRRSADALAELMTFGRVLGTGTVYENIQSVAAGGTLHVSSGVVGVEPPARSPLGSAELEIARPTDLRAAVRAALASCLVTSRPIGLALSGGLDSTILAFELNEMGIEDLVTVSVRIEGTDEGVGDLSELGLPAHGAWTTWRHRTIEVTPATYPDLLEEAVSALGMPTRMSSAPLYIALAQAAAEAGVVVLLTGEGPDELFGGYLSYRDWRRARRDHDPGAMRSLLDDLGTFACPPVRRKWLERLLSPAAVDQSLARFAAVYAGAVEQHMGNVTATGQSCSHAFEALRQVELSLSLEPLLLRTDHCLMRYAIEGRMPFLHGIVPAIAATLGVEQLLVGDRTKAAFLQGWTAVLPEQRWAQPKKAFRAPLQRWLAGPLARWCRRRLAEAAPSLTEVGFDREAIEELVDALMAGEPEAAHLAYSSVTVAHWLADGEHSSSADEAERGVVLELASSTGGTDGRAHETCSRNV